MTFLNEYKNTLKSLCTGAALAVLCCTSGVRADSGDPLLLLDPVDQLPAVMPDLEDFVIRYRPVTVRLDTLDGAGPGDALALELFDDESLVGIIERVERRSKRRYSCFGHIDGFPSSHMLLVVEVDVMIARISLPSLGLLYTVRYASDGVHLICELDESAMSECGGAPTPPAAPVPQAARESESDPKLPEYSGGGDSLMGDCSDAGYTIDAMIVYTPGARMAAGGTNAIRALCQTAIDLTNTAYNKSRIITQIRTRLVYRGEVNYNENGTFSDHLDRLTDPDDGIMDQVTTWRRASGADQIMLLVADNSSCGLAWCAGGGNIGPEWAFGVVSQGCVDGHSYAHELGHNMGAAHDRQNAGDCAYHGYSYGWRFFGDSGNRYRTVMAYRPGTRIPYFSNPDVDFENTPTGVANKEHNAKTLELVGPIVSDYRLTRFSVWVDFNHSGMEFGTFAFPFNTMAEGVARILGAPPDGRPSLRIKPGSTSETITITKSMSLNACGGTVRIGG